MDTLSNFLELMGIFSTIVAEKSCYQGWTFHLDHCYKSFPEPRAWREARAYCRLFPEGDLACFITAADQHFVQTEVIQRRSEPYWIGLQGNLSSWTWASGSDISAFSSFRGGSTNLIGNSGDNLCVILRNSWWTAVPCDESNRFICQAKSVECHTELGWIMTISKHCIKVMAAPSGWYDGRNTCRRQGADLARFHSRSELNFLTQNLSLPYNQYWVDLGSFGSNCEGINITENRVDPFYENCSIHQMFICEISSCASRDEEYGCTSMFCISRNLLCNGRGDCPTGSDESISLCGKSTVTEVSSEDVTEQPYISSSANQRDQFSISMSSQNTPSSSLTVTVDIGQDEITEASIQCFRTLDETKKNLCYKELAQNFTGIVGYVGEMIGALNFPESVKMYLDISNAILSLTAENGRYASVFHIMNISSVLEDVERDLTSSSFFNNVYIEERENIELRIKTHAWKMGSNSRRSGNKTIQLFSKGHKGNTDDFENILINGSHEDNITIIVIIIDNYLTDNRTMGTITDDVIRISPVLSLSAFKEGDYISLHHTFTLQHYTSIIKVNDGFLENGTVKCGFIDKQTRSWSYDGCVVLVSTSWNTTCFCNHTTNFAILMQIKDFKVERNHALALNIITYIGCTVSLITQVIAITVFSCVGSLNSERICVHKNLCYAITAAQLVFLVGIRAVQIKIICSIIALLLHYFYSAVFVWMLVEGMLLYSKVVQVFGSEKSRIVYYYAFGWGLPLIILIISATANWKGYGTDRSCWLSMSDGTVWAFVGPAVSIILVNMVILWIVIRIIIHLERSDEYKQIRSSVKGAIFLLPLLGLTWIFGLMAVNKDTIIFQYLFAVFNSLQGFFVFLFHCVCNSEVRQALQRLREKRILSRGEFITSSDIPTQTDAAVSPSNEENILRRKSRSVKPYKTCPHVQVTSLTHVNSKEDIETKDKFHLENLLSLIPN
ncbi:adhesion G-protein coupled receptor G7-like [Saccostrea cucullata]|uniref:adhesion G-protein coupled receptor G7-like n=1 Tax=Saccostrea cuccullata TaxID=36930 RepID=UPI002ED21CDE